MKKFAQHTLLEIISSRRDEKTPSVFFYGGYDRKTAYTCEDIWQKSARFAALIGPTNEKDQLVLIALLNGADFVAAFFGSLMAGWIPVPLQSSDFQKSVDYQERIQKLQRVTSSSVLVSTSDTLEKLKIPGITRILHPRSADTIEPLPDHQICAIRPEDTCFIQFSSGSTQAPKGVVLSHANLLANLEQIRDGMDSSAADVGCTWLPFFHDMGWIGAFLSPLYTGFPIHVLNPFDFLSSPLGWLSLASKIKATLILGPDFGFRMCYRKIAATEVVQLDLSSVRLALSGGETVSEKTCAEFSKHFSTAGFNANAFFPVYGLAENSLAVTFPKPGQGVRTLSVDFDALSQREVKFTPPDHAKSVKLVSCGKALKDIQIKISDDTGSSVGNGQVGHILIQSPSMTKAYFKNSDMTMALYADDWLKTGDLGFFHEDELYLVDRYKDTIILRGKNYYPADLEAKISQVNQFRFGRCAVVSKFNPETQVEQIHAVVETREFWPWKRTALKKHLAQKLSEYCPVGVDQIHAVAPCTLPRTSSGKVKHYELKQMLLAQKIERSEKNFVREYLMSKLNLLSTIAGFLWKRRKEKPPLNALLEHYLKLNIAKIAGKSEKTIKRDTPFAALQMDSLTLVQLHSKIRDDFAAIPLHQLIELKNISELSAHLLEHHGPQVERWAIRNEL